MRLDRKISSFERLTYRHYRVVHGLRIGLAFILTFLLIRLLEVPEGTWPLITLVVVMGPISFRQCVAAGVAAHRRHGIWRSLRPDCPVS